MAVLDRRVPVLFDPERYAALERLAREERKSVGAVIRDAVDERLDRKKVTRGAAWRRLLERADARPSVPVGDWEAVKDDFERAHLGGIA
jgi:hypothetical protein